MLLRMLLISALVGFVGGGFVWFSWPIAQRLLKRKRETPTPPETDA